MKNTYLKYFCGAFLLLVWYSGRAQYKVRQNNEHLICSDFKKFWHDFQNAIRLDDTARLKKVFVLPDPIMANIFATFNHYFYTDSIDFYAPKGLFDTLHITTHNFPMYYKRLFSRYLKHMILDITVDKIAKDDNELTDIKKLPITDSICSIVYVYLNLVQSRDYSMAVVKGGDDQVKEYTISLKFERVQQEYRIAWVQAAN